MSSARGLQTTIFNTFILLRYVFEPFHTITWFLPFTTSFTTWMRTLCRELDPCICEDRPNTRKPINMLKLFLSSFSLILAIFLKKTLKVNVHLILRTQVKRKTFLVHWVINIYSKKSILYINLKNGKIVIKKRRR